MVRSGFSWLTASVAFALGAAVAAACIVFSGSVHSVSATSRINPPADLEPSQLPTLGELSLMPSESLEKQDLALLNLRCAEGLPGAENLDVAGSLSTIDRWAKKVESETNRHLYRFRQKPSDYEDSENYFRMMMLVTVLQQDCGIRYNPERIREIDFTKSKDLFLHGMVNGQGSDANGGTCVSMPVLYTAVARRLNYPVFLVPANAHLFCRWDSPQERFNVEATNQGMNSFDDDYYMKWPKPISKADVEQGLYLKSLNSTEAFAVFLAARGHCFEDNRRGAKARVAYALAHERSPQHPLYIRYLAQTLGPLRPPRRDIAAIANSRQSIPGPSMPFPEGIHKPSRQPWQGGTNLMPPALNVQNPTGTNPQIKLPGRNIR